MQASVDTERVSTGLDRVGHRRCRAPSVVASRMTRGGLEGRGLLEVRGELSSPIMNRIADGLRLVMSL